jgi:hypothetical protein
LVLGNGGAETSDERLGDVRVKRLYLLLLFEGRVHSGIGEISINLVNGENICSII